MLDWFADTFEHLNIQHLISLYSAARTTTIEIRACTACACTLNAVNVHIFILFFLCFSSSLKCNGLDSIRKYTRESFYQTKMKSEKCRAWVTFVQRIWWNYNSLCYICRAIARTEYVKYFKVLYEVIFSLHLSLIFLFHIVYYDFVIVLVLSTFKSNQSHTDYDINRYFVTIFFFFYFHIR